MTRTVRAALGSLLVLVLVVLALGLELDSSLTALLPADGPVARAARVAEEAVGDTLLIEVNGAGASRAQLLDATDALAASLQQTGRFSDVRYRVTGAEMAAMGQIIGAHAIALVPEQQLAAHLSPAGVHRTLNKQLVRLSGPGGGLFESSFVQDPLDLRGLAASAVRSRAIWSLALEDGHFLDATGTRAVVLLSPSLTMLDDEAGELAALLETQLDACALPARYFGGHLIAARAAASMKADVRFSAVLGGLALLALLTLVLRRLRPLVAVVLFTVVPLAATLAAAALLSPVHAISLAFCGALMGTAVDYWLHLYVHVAEQDAEGDRYQQAVEAWTRLGPAIGLGAGSTAAVFGLLTFSRFPVVANLGWMGLASTAAAVVAAALLAPLGFGLLGAASPRMPALTLPGGPRLALLGLFVAGLLAWNAPFDGDPRHLLAADPGVESLEQELQGRYGAFGVAGVVTARAPSQAAALDLAYKATTSLRSLPGVSVSSPSDLLPGPQSAARRQAALPPIEVLNARVAAAAVELGFRPEVLEPGVAALYEAAGPLTPGSWSEAPVAGTLARQVRTGLDEYLVVLDVVFADDGLIDLAGAQLAHEAPGVELVVPSHLASEGIAEIRDELMRLGGFALLTVCLLLLLRYRRPALLVAAVLPSLAAVAFACAGIVLAGATWNAISVAAMVLVIGLGLDYGVFMVEAELRSASGSTRTAVGLGALTTQLGFAPLIFASNPGISGVGIAVCAGTAGAAWVALTATPDLAAGRPMLGEGGRRWLQRTALAALMLLNLDTLLLLNFVLPAPGERVQPSWALQQQGGERSAGPNRLVRAKGIWTLYLEGDAFERGYAGGLLTEDLIERLETETRERFEEAVPSRIAREAILRGLWIAASKLDEQIPTELLREIDGYAEGARDPWPSDPPPYTRRVYFHALHDIGQALADAPFVDACTGFIAGPGSTTDGHWLLARNFDFDGAPAFDRDKVVSFVKPDDGQAFVSVSFASMVGAVSGMNEHGLAVAIQAATTDSPVRVGTPMTLIVREILQFGSSLDDAHALLEQRSGFVSENVLVVDGQAGEAALFEVGPDRVVRVDIESRIGVANHFRDPAWADDEANRHQRDHTTSGARQARMDELLDQQPLSMRRAVEILSDRQQVGGTPLPRGHRHALNADIATHGVVFDATARTLWVSRYPNLEGGWVAYDLRTALAGDLEPVEVVPRGDVTAALSTHEARRQLHLARAAGDPEAALVHLRRALELAPGLPAAQLELARTLQALGQPAAATEVLEQAMATGFEYTEQLEEAVALRGAVQ